MENIPDVAVFLLCDHPQQQLHVWASLGRRVTFVFAAAGVADVEVGALEGEDLIGVAERNVHAALRGEHVDEAVVAPGAGTALGGWTAAGGVQAGICFVLQRTEVTQQGVLAQSREEQGGHSQQARGQDPA